MAWVTDHHPTRSELDACVQCGLCLPACPTFRLTGRETASPRGRIQAMDAVAKGLVPVDDTFAGLLDFCLGCRACEPVCPGMVPYGRMLEGARAEIEEQVQGRSRLSGLLAGTALRSRLLRKLSGWSLAAAQRLKLTSLSPRRFRRLVAGARDLRQRGPSIVGYSSGEATKVALLAGCIQDEWFRPVNRATVQLLERAGYGVEAPNDQTCCGALAAHSGLTAQAEQMSSQNLDAFAQFDTVVATAAGCSAHLREAGWEGTEVLDVTVAIARAVSEGRLPELPPNGKEIAVQDPCHLRHAQRVVDEPRQILVAAGYTVVEIDTVGMCCGAAGLYTINQPEASAQLGEAKAQQVREARTRLVASANPGCEMQLRSYLDSDYEIRHPVEWYAEAIGSGR